MAISFPPDVEKFIETELASQHYPSREELLAEAVRFLSTGKRNGERGADWFELALDQFQSILRLPPGWDANNAAAPDPKLVHVAADLLYRLNRHVQCGKPHINPTRRGGIQLEWEAGSRSFELEVLAEDHVIWFFQDVADGIEEAGEFSPSDTLNMLSDYIHRAETS